MNSAHTPYVSRATEMQKWNYLRLKRTILEGGLEYKSDLCVLSRKIEMYAL